MVVSDDCFYLKYVELLQALIAGLTAEIMSCENN